MLFYLQARKFSVTKWMSSEIGRITRKCKWNFVIRYRNLRECYPFRFFMRSGTGILASMSAISAWLLNSHFRHKLRVGSYGRLSSYLAVVASPAIMSGLFHTAVSVMNIFLWNVQLTLRISSVCTTKCHITKVRLSHVLANQSWCFSRLPWTSLSTSTCTNCFLHVCISSLHIPFTFDHGESQRNSETHPEIHQVS